MIAKMDKVFAATIALKRIWFAIFFALHSFNTILNYYRGCRNE